jgi:hypothetical protein
MATRMATVLYGEKPNADVEAGNRVDTFAAAGPAPERALAPEVSATPTVPSPPPVSPMSPPALRGLVLGLAAAGAVFAGLSLAGIALAWSNAMTSSAQLALLLVGGALVAAGVAYIASARPASVSHV